MAQPTNDNTGPALHIADSNHPGAERLSQQVNVMDQLRLKDPSKQTTADLLQNPWLVVTPLDQHSAMNDPHKFLATASKMTDRAPGGNLTLDLLQETQQSRSASNDEKTVARTLTEQYSNVITDEPHTLMWMTKYFGGTSGRAVREDGLDGLKQQLHAADAFAQHPELKGPQSLAYSFKHAFESVKGIQQDYVTFRPEDLAAVAASSEFTDQERAAAELVKLNFAKFATLGDKDPTSFSVPDLIALAKIGLPKGVQLTPETCEKSNPTANAVGSAIAVGLISHALGSKQSVSNALVAGASAAITTEVVNKMNCGDK